MATNNPSPKKALPQKSVVKKNTDTVRNAGATLQQEWKEWTDDWKKQFWSWLQTLEKFRSIEKNNYDLGHQHLSNGYISDAIFRFRFVLWLNPGRADAWYYLGCAYLAKQDKRMARQAFERAVILNPSYEEAGYMLALVAGKAITWVPPAPFVVE